jgi:hypothetical protein
MAGTTMVAVKQALVDQLGALPALADAFVSYGHPGERGRKELIWLGDVRIGDQEPVAIKAGRRRREESYELELNVEVAGTKLAPERSELRAVELGTVVEEYLADHPMLSPPVAGVLFVVVTGATLRTVDTSNGPVSRLTFTVQVKARLL